MSTNESYYNKKLLRDYILKKASALPQGTWIQISNDNIEIGHTRSGKLAVADNLYQIQINSEHLEVLLKEIPLYKFLTNQRQIDEAIENMVTRLDLNPQHSPDYVIKLC